MGECQIHNASTRAASQIIQKTWQETIIWGIYRLKPCARRHGRVPDAGCVARVRAWRSTRVPARSARHFVTAAATWMSRLRRQNTTQAHKYTKTKVEISVLWKPKRQAELSYLENLWMHNCCMRVQTHDTPKPRMRVQQSQRHATAYQQCSMHRVTKMKILQWLRSKVTRIQASAVQHDESTQLLRDSEMWKLSTDMRISKRCQHSSAKFIFDSNLAQVIQTESGSEQQ